MCVSSCRFTNSPAELQQYLQWLVEQGQLAVNAAGWYMLPDSEAQAQPASDAQGADSATSSSAAASPRQPAPPPSRGAPDTASPPPSGAAAPAPKPAPAPRPSPDGEPLTLRGPSLEPLEAMQAFEDAARLRSPSVDERVLLEGVLQRRQLAEQQRRLKEQQQQQQRDEEEEQRSSKQRQQPSASAAPAAPPAAKPADASPERRGGAPVPSRAPPPLRDGASSPGGRDDGAGGDDGLAGARSKYNWSKYRPPRPKSPIPDVTPVVDALRPVVGKVVDQVVEQLPDRIAQLREIAQTEVQPLPNIPGAKMVQDMLSTRPPSPSPDKSPGPAASPRGSRGEAGDSGGGGVSPRAQRTLLQRVVEVATDSRVVAAATVALATQIAAEQNPAAQESLRAYIQVRDSGRLGTCLQSQFLSQDDYFICAIRCGRCDCTVLTRSRPCRRSTRCARPRSRAPQARQWTRPRTASSSSSSSSGRTTRAPKKRRRRSRTARCSRRRPNPPPPPHSRPRRTSRRAHRRP